MFPQVKNLVYVFIPLKKTAVKSTYRLNDCAIPGVDHYDLTTNGICNGNVFTACIAVQQRESCLSVCPTICPSDKCVDCDKTEEISVQIFFTIRKII